MSPRQWNLPPLRDSTYPTPDDLSARRTMAASMTPAARAAEVTVNNTVHGGVECVVCRAANPFGRILYLHGGGFRLGSPTGSTSFATRIAAATGSEVVVARYRLAPEHPFPAGLTDVVAVYDALLDLPSEDVGGGRIVAMGDSAGGGLATSLTVACLAAGVEAPKALVLLSPWLDLTCEAPTFETKAETEKLFPHASAQQASAMYLQGHDSHDPLASPVFASVDRFPSTLIYASCDEALLADTTTLATALAHAGRDVTMSVQTETRHAWAAIDPDEARSVRTVAEIGRFVRGLG